MPYVLSLLLVAVLAASPTAGAASPRDRCPHRPGEKTLARSAEAVVTERSITSRTDFTTTQTIYGCSRRSGRRRVVLRNAEGETDSHSVVALKLAGTRIAGVLDHGYKDISFEWLFADDALHAGRHRELSKAFRWPYPYSYGVLSFAVASDGTVAWVTVGADHQLLVWRAGDLRRRDVGFDLSGPLSVSDGTLRWTHGGAPREAPVVLPPSACGQPAATEGTDAVDLFVHRDRLTACRRATGASLSLDGSYASLALTIDVAGPYVALTGHDAVRRLDLATSSINTIPAAQPTSARVDEAGSLAWYDNAQSLLSQLWVRDAGGTRAVGAPVNAYGVLGRDGAQIRHGQDVVAVLNP
jgi:hypothetical protein